MADPIQVPPGPMRVAEFLSWAEQQPEDRFELSEGEVVAMAAEQVAHIRTKNLVWLALRNAIREAGAPCEAHGDGLSVKISETSAYRPDALVHCGEPLARTALVAPHPVVVIEVTSPSTSRVDAIAKFTAYMRLPSVRHYLILDAEHRLVIHHQRLENGEIRSAIAGGGALTLDPPGIAIRVEDLFE